MFSFPPGSHWWGYRVCLVFAGRSCSWRIVLVLRWRRPVLILLLAQSSCWRTSDSTLKRRGKGKMLQGTRWNFKSGFHVCLLWSVHCLCCSLSKTLMVNLLLKGCQRSLVQRVPLLCGSFEWNTVNFQDETAQVKGYRWLCQRWCSL